jgi:hypothetical protein
MNRNFRFLRNIDRQTLWNIVVVQEEKEGGSGWYLY